MCAEAFGFPFQWNKETIIKNSQMKDNKGVQILLATCTSTSASICFSFFFITLSVYPSDSALKTVFFFRFSVIISQASETHGKKCILKSPESFVCTLRTLDNKKAHFLVSFSLFLLIFWILTTHVTLRTICSPQRHFSIIQCTWDEFRSPY